MVGLRQCQPPAKGEHLALRARDEAELGGPRGEQRCGLTMGGLLAGTSTGVGCQRVDEADSW